MSSSSCYCMHFGKWFVRAAIVVAVLALAVWFALRRERGKVQLVSVVHTTEAGVHESGWFMLSNPLPHEVLCIPHSIQTLSPTGWVNIRTMSATNDPFTYDLRNYPFDRVLKPQGSFYFTPQLTVSNEIWRVTVRCIERSLGDTWGHAINSKLSKHFPRNGASARTYSGWNYEVYSSEP